MSAEAVGAGVALEAGAGAAAGSEAGASADVLQAVKADKIATSATVFFIVNPSYLGKVEQYWVFCYYINLILITFVS